MKPLSEIRYQIERVKKLIETDNKSEIKLEANGGNSILLICSPEEEYLFIEELHKFLPQDKYALIDVNHLLIEFIGKYKEEIMEKLNLLQSSVHQVFKAPAGEDDNDFFKYIIEKIKTSFEERKVPFLYSVGALYGTGIDNIHIMEHKDIMNAQLPLVILYPATMNNDRLMFLNSRPASKYRCALIR
jgi:hypothetical protein